MSMKWARRTWLLVLPALIACSTGPFLRPIAPVGDLVRWNPACPEPLNVLSLTPAQTTWVHLRIYATLRSKYQPDDELHIEVRTQVGLGMPRAEWNTDEFTRRAAKHFTLSATSPVITIIMPDGTSRQMPVDLFKGEHDFHSNTIELAHEDVPVPGVSLEESEVRFPTVQIDGQPIVVPPIRFQRDEEWYFPVLNC